MRFWLRRSTRRIRWSGVFRFSLPISTPVGKEKSLHVEFLPIQSVLSFQNDHDTILTMIAQVLLRYGGRDLLDCNGIVNSTLVLLSSIFSHCRIGRGRRRRFYRVHRR